MKPTLTLLAVLLLGPLCALHAADPKNPAQTPSRPTAFLYELTPNLGMPGVTDQGLLADIIPFFWKGQFHLLHLQLKPGQKGFDWAQIVTRDFVAYEYKGVAIPGGGTDDAIDRDIFTGSVFAKDNTLYAFYCGHNGSFNKEKKPDQLMLLATSEDGIHWSKQKDFMLTPAGDNRYRWPGGFRDGLVFWNPEKKEYGMVITATPVSAPNGGLAYASSADLRNWKIGDPFPASGRFPGYECPDLFQWGDRWYLILSTYWRNPGWTTRYMTAPKLEGPWTSPAGDFFDGGTLYAAKSVSDGKRRFLCGTLTRRDPNDKGVSTDDAANGWSGRILVYEMHQRSDGTMGVRIPPEVEKSFGPANRVTPPQNPEWASAGEGVRSDRGPARAQLGTLPSRCLVSAELTVPPAGRAGFWFGGSKDGKDAFRLYVDAGSRRLCWDRWEKPLGSNPEKERNYRPLDVKPGDRIRIKVALDGNGAVACVNDDVCLSTRMYDRRDNLFGIWSDTAGAGFAGVMLQTDATEGNASAATASSATASSATASSATAPAFADFANGVPDAWTTSGVTFGKEPRNEVQGIDSRIRTGGTYHSPGAIRSPGFKIEKPYIILDVTTTAPGGRIPQLAIVDTGPSDTDWIVRRSERQNAEAGIIYWDVRDYLGCTGRIEIVDIGNSEDLGFSRIKFSEDSPLVDDGRQDREKAAAAWPEMMRDQALDPQKPIYHLTPPCSLLVDVNGCVKRDGYTYIYYLATPWKGAHWMTAAARSKDLITWEFLPLSIWPSNQRGEVSIFSGDTVMADDGSGYLFYTSTGIDKFAVWTPQQWNATSRDWITWTKSENPAATMRDIPAGISHVRDPYVFKNQGTWFMALTGMALKPEYARTFANAPVVPFEAGRGCLMLLQSPNLKDWSFKGVALYSGEKPLWEMPTLFEYPNGWIFSPGGKEYYSGTLDLAGAKFTTRQHGRVTEGTMYAHRGLRRDDGSYLVWARAANHDGVQCLTIPRVWRLDKEGRLRQTPAPELASLRGKHYHQGETAVTGVLPFDECATHTGEIVVELSLGTAKSCGIILRHNKDRSQGYRIAWNGKELNIGPIAPTKFSKEWWGMNRAIKPDVHVEDDGRIRLHIFLDRGLLEFIANDSLSFERPLTDFSLDDTGVSLFSEGGAANLHSLDYWPMQGLLYQMRTTSSQVNSHNP